MNKNIILQHWTGELNELCKLSSKNISSYAAIIGADYKLLRGNLFRENLSTPCQKVYMLDAVFDDYDSDKLWRVVNKPEKEWML